MLLGFPVIAPAGSVMRPLMKLAPLPLGDGNRKPSVPAPPGQAAHQIAGGPEAAVVGGLIRGERRADRSHGQACSHRGHGHNAADLRHVSTDPKFLATLQDSGTNSGWVDLS